MSNLRKCTQHGHYSFVDGRTEVQVIYTFGVMNRHHIWQGVLILAIFVFNQRPLQAQYEGNGLILGFGIGLGFSSHAGSYKVQELFRTKEFSGFRAYLLEGRLGYRIGEYTSVSAVGKISPANTTVSPYKSYYTGLAVTQTLFGEEPLYIIVGAGRNKASISEGIDVGSGTLYNLGFGKRLVNKFHLELNTHFGSIDVENNLEPNSFGSSEFQFFVTFSYNLL